jgi:mycothiol synthase
VQRRPYRDGDLARLQAVVEEWIWAHGRTGYDHSGALPHRIYENLRGRRPVGDLVHVWEDGSVVAAISICLRFGCAFDLFLAPHLWGTPAEHQLLEDAYRTTARFADPDEEYIVTDVFGGNGGRQDALRRLGFERYRVWDDVRERRLDEPIDVSGELSTVDGVVIRSATVDDADGLAAARNASFEEDWTGDQYRREVMGKAGYDPDREIVAVAPDGRIAAYTVYWTDTRNGLGLFEPVGTHREFRRLGLGRAVMLHAMERMRSAGLVSVSVNHNADNEAARRLYESLGFVRIDQTYGFHRRNVSFSRPG